MTYASAINRAPGRPLRCRTCQREMAVRIWHPNYGVIHDELETIREGSMRRKHHEPLPQEGLDEPFGPPPEEYLYRCPVCGEERLVNEAIIDVAVGAAKFRGEYNRRMPTLGCSRMQRRDHVYIEQSPSPPVGVSLKMRTSGLKLLPVAFVLVVTILGCVLDS